MSTQQAQGQADFPLEETTVKINRTAKVVKGGRRFAFSALVVVGDRRGRVGWGFGKAKDVPGAIAKATGSARRKVVQVPLEGGTVLHEVTGRYSSSEVYIRPAHPGTGVIAGGAVRLVLEAAGVRDVLSKARGSTNPLNLLKATFNAFSQYRTREEVEALRGVKLDPVYLPGRRRKAWI